MSAVSWKKPYAGLLAMTALSVLSPDAWAKIAWNDIHQKVTICEFRESAETPTACTPSDSVTEIVESGFFSSNTLGFEVQTTRRNRSFDVDEMTIGQYLNKEKTTPVAYQITFPEGASARLFKQALENGEYTILVPRKKIAYHRGCDLHGDYIAYAGPSTKGGDRLVASCPGTSFDETLSYREAKIKTPEGIMDLPQFIDAYSANPGKFATAGAMDCGTNAILLHPRQPRKAGKPNESPEGEPAPAPPSGRAAWIFRALLPEAMAESFIQNIALDQRIKDCASHEDSVKKGADGTEWKLVTRIRDPETKNIFETWLDSKTGLVWGDLLRENRDGIKTRLEAENACESGLQASLANGGVGEMQFGLPSMEETGIAKEHGLLKVVPPLSALQERNGLGSFWLSDSYERQPEVYGIYFDVDRGRPLVEMLKHYISVRCVGRPRHAFFQAEMKRPEAAVEAAPKTKRPRR